MRHRDPVLRSVSDSSGGFDWRPAGHGSYRRVDSFGANRYTREASSSGNLSSPRRASNQACVAASVAALQDLKVAEQQVTACDEVKVDVSQSPQQSVEAGTGTPAATQPNTALGVPTSGMLPTLLFSFLPIASLGALAYANVQAMRRHS